VCLSIGRGSEGEGGGGGGAAHTSHTPHAHCVWAPITPGGAVRTTRCRLMMTLLSLPVAAAYRCGCITLPAVAEPLACVRAHGCMVGTRARAP
jgi:hypothetical protein